MATVFDDAPNLPLLRDVLERALLLPAEFVVLILVRITSSAATMRRSESDCCFMLPSAPKY